MNKQLGWKQDPIETVYKHLACNHNKSDVYFAQSTLQCTQQLIQNSCLMFQADNKNGHTLPGYSLGQQPDAEHLSVLGRERHGPDVIHSLLDGTWLRSASHNRQSSASSQRGQRPVPPCDVLVALWQCAVTHCYVSVVSCYKYLVKSMSVFEGGYFEETYAYIVLFKKTKQTKKNNKPAMVRINANRYVSWSDLPWTRNSPSLSLGLSGCAHEKASASVTVGSRPRRLRVRGFVRPPAAWRQPRPPPRLAQGGESRRPDSPAPPCRSAAAWCDERCSRSSPTMCAKC